MSKKIKVKSCKNPKWWYAKQIGKEFEKLPGTAQYNGAECYIVKTPEGLTHKGIGYINPDDAIFVEDKPEAGKK